MAHRPLEEPCHLAQVRHDSFVDAYAARLRAASVDVFEDIYRSLGELLNEVCVAEC
jgi:hypothetical protein